MTVDEIHKPPRPGGNSSIIELNFNYSLGRSSLTSHLLTLSLMPFQSTDDHACDALSSDPCGNGDEIELLVLQPRIKSKLSLRCDQVPDIFFFSRQIVSDFMRKRKQLGCRFPFRSSVDSVSNTKIPNRIVRNMEPHRGFTYRRLRQCSPLTTGCFLDQWFYFLWNCRSWPELPHSINVKFDAVIRVRISSVGR